MVTGFVKGATRRPCAAARDDAGCAHFEAHSWATALRFFTAAAAYAAGPSEAARAHQTRAVCCMALKDHAR
jgi:hypothetical protein